VLENPQPLVETRLDESVGRGRTVGCCRKWEFELFLSFLKVALEFPLWGSSQKRAYSSGDAHPTKGLPDGMFGRVAEAIVLLDTDDRILQVNPEFTKVCAFAQDERLGTAAPTQHG
jgi:hypothetical protein